jgi:hypothetical protein
MNPVKGMFLYLHTYVNQVFVDGNSRRQGVHAEIYLLRLPSQFRRALPCCVDPSCRFPFRAWSLQAIDLTSKKSCTERKENRPFPSLSPLAEKRVCVDRLLSNVRFFRLRLFSIRNRRNPLTNEGSLRALSSRKRDGQGGCSAGSVVGLRSRSFTAMRVPDTPLQSAGTMRRAPLASPRPSLS